MARFMKMRGAITVIEKNLFDTYLLRSPAKYPLCGDELLASGGVCVEKLPPNPESTLSSASLQEWGAGATERTLARSISSAVI